MKVFESEMLQHMTGINPLTTFFLYRKSFYDVSKLDVGGKPNRILRIDLA